MKSLELLAIELETAQEIKNKAAAREKEIKEEILKRYEGNLVNLLAEKSEPYGTVNITEDDFIISVNVPKKIKWEQDRLANLCKQITAGNENPLDYIDIEYNVPESKYKNWPQIIKDEFIAARTIQPGSPAVTIKRKEV